MKYLQLDYSAIQDKYPKSLERIINWFSSREDLITYLKREGANDVLKVIKEQMVPMVIQHDPRKLYEFFDQNEIIVSVYMENIRQYFIYTHNKIDTTDAKDNRMDAEQAAFMQALDYLENRLINGEG